MRRAVTLIMGAAILAMVGVLVYLNLWLNGQESNKRAQQTSAAREALARKREGIQDQNESQPSEENA